MPEPLRQFLSDELGDTPVELDEGEVISDAIVIYRVSSINDESYNGLNERYEYSVTKGLNLAMALGMLKLTQETITAFYWVLLNREEDGD